MEVILKKAQAGMPLFRELFSDVVSKRAYGNIHQVWHFPGHIVITTNEGRKLFTFSCVPIALQQAFEQKPLDIQSLVTPLLDCHMLTEDVIALIDSCGAVKLWEFTGKCTWVPCGAFSLCDANNVEVISVVSIRSLQELVWCEYRHKLQSPLSSPFESQTGQYCICRKRLPKHCDAANLPVTVIVHNVPRCDVHVFDKDKILISTRFDRSKVTVYMLCDLSEDTMTLYVEEKTAAFDIKDGGIDFQDFVMTLLCIFVKAEPGRGDCGLKTDETGGYAVVLNSTGVVDVFSYSDSNKKQVCKKTVQLTKCDVDPSVAQQTHWFVSHKMIGIIVRDMLSMYSLTSGEKLCVTKLDKSISVQMVVPSKSSVFMAWLLAADQLYCIQAKDTSAKDMLSTPDKLPNDNLLQTDILRLARLQQRKLEDYNLSLAGELDELRIKWEEHGGNQQQNEVGLILAPYVDEYWRLDKLSKALLSSEQPLLETDPSYNARSLVSAVMETRSIGRPIQHAKLLWLSQVYPQELLDFLCQGISFTTETVDQNELRQWQTLIGLDGGDLLNFELVCRLLFQLEPKNLVPFVRCAEAVAEQTVGVSAFIRKKNSLIYCKAACECLQECLVSADPKMAASSKAKLIWASECENCEERALKCYLNHGLWSESLDLLKKVELADKAKARDGSEGCGAQGGDRTCKDRHLLPTLLHVTVTAFAQNQVLADYTDELFALMTNWKSFQSFCKVVAGHTEIRQQQLSRSADSIFAYDNQKTVPLAAVRTHLLDLIKDIDSKA